LGAGYGPGEEDILAASYNAELPWRDLTLYSTGTLSHRSSKKNTGSFLPNLAPVAGVTAGRPQNRNSLPEVYPDGFNALRRIFELDFQTTVGARGVAKGWDWDLSTTFAQDHAQLDGQNTSTPPWAPTVRPISTCRPTSSSSGPPTSTSPASSRACCPGRSRCRGGWSSATSTS
jgi:iron complex outermembrane receptor protein